MMRVLEIYAEHGQTDIAVVSLFLDTLRVLLQKADAKMLKYFNEKRAMEIFTSMSSIALSYL
jgi:hypothetical protein